MDLSTYERVIKSESTAFRYVSGFCRENGHRICPRCRSRKLYRVGSRRRCAACRYTFGEFTGRWLGAVRLDPGRWLRVIKLFELELSTRRMAQQLGLDYRTAYRAVAVIRAAIVAHAPDADRLLGGEIELDEAYFGGRRKGKRGRGAAGKIPVFGILERDGRVCVEVVPNVKAETVLALAVEKVRRGSIVYTDRFQIYDSLMFCGYRHLKIDHAVHFSRGRVHINGLEGFWSFAKERLMKHHGIAPRHFPFYLKEMEFRFNHRHDDIFTYVIKYLCDPVPKTD